MTAVKKHPLEELLQLIAQAEPQSWYPRAHAETHEIPLEAIYHYLELLYLEGLVVKGETTADKGPGVVLTLRGKRLLEDEEGLQRLRQGKAIEPGERGGIVREALRYPAPPIVTRLLLLANFLVFGYGLYLAWPGRAGAFVGAFLRSDPVITPILERSGGLTGIDLIKGQWWRLLTCCFVHIGLLHLLMNMWMLQVAGKYVEQMWGWLRFLAIYLLAGIGGSCVAMAYQPGILFQDQVIPVQLCGASGALCGLLSAEAVWMFLNRKFLQRDLVRRWRISFLGIVVLLVVVSLLPGVSGLGHLGGAIAGLIVALLLHWHRFGPQPWRWLGLLALLPLPWLGYALIDRARHTNPIWHGLEAIQFADTYYPQVRQVMRKIDALDEKRIQPAVRKNWQRREPPEVDQALEAVAEAKESLTRLQQSLSHAGPYYGAEAAEARDKALEYIQAWLQEMNLDERSLREKEEFKPRDERTLNEQRKTVARLRKEWQNLFVKKD